MLLGMTTPLYWQAVRYLYDVLLWSLWVCLDLAYPFF